MRVQKTITIALLVLSVTGLATADETTEATDPALRPLAPERAEVGGTCSTPRQAWLQHLWWSAREDWERASLCFEREGIDSAKAEELAERLFDHLNANALFIDTSNPEAADPNYVNPATGRAIYRDAKAPAFVIRRGADGRWRFASEGLAEVPGFSIGKRIARRLPAWFRTKVLGVTTWSYLGVVLLIFLAFLTRRFVMFFVNRYLRRWAKSARLPYISKITHQLDRPTGGMSMALVFYLGFPLLSFPVRVSSIALVATKALAAFSVVWLGYRLIDVLSGWLASRAETTESKLDDQLVPLVSKTLKVFVSVLGGIFVLQNLNVNVSSLLAGVGLGGLAFALAAKDTVANFFGSVMIFIDKPFQIGDWVEIGTAEGTVEEVGFRTTRIRTFYNSQVTLPNSLIANTKVDNYGARQYRRYVANLGLTYDTPPAKIQAFCEALRGVIARLEGMRKDYYMVEFKEFGDSGLIILLYCFMVSKTWNDELRTRTQLNLEILRVAEDLGVSFAFPTQTLHVDSVATPTDAPTSSPGPESIEDIAAVVASYAPGGERGRAGFEISPGYECGRDWSGEAKARGGEGAGVDG